ncbi:MAG: hypothetical protein Q8891_02045 [Bacteroidota bacterium]|nr:hypothetical protein [Bacteroidota bacterium]
MKSNVTRPTVQLDNYGQQDTLATGVNVNENDQKRNFTTADMWKLNRRVRSASSMVRRRHLG